MEKQTALVSDGQVRRIVKDHRPHRTSFARRNECLELDVDLPPEFKVWCRTLYRAIRGDQGRHGAWDAFQKLTTGRRAMSSSSLLIHLAAEYPEGHPAAWFDGWEVWKSGWEGIQRNAASLRLIASKMKMNIGKAAGGPAPLAFMGVDSWNAKYKESASADNLLSSIVHILESGIPILEIYCAMHRGYLEELRESPNIQRQEEATIGLLRAVREHTGHCWFARLAVLINVSRSLNCIKKHETAESLRKLWERRPR